MNLSPSFVLRKRNEIIFRFLLLIENILLKHISAKKKEEEEVNYLYRMLDGKIEL